MYLASSHGRNWYNDSTMAFNNYAKIMRARYTHRPSCRRFIIVGLISVIALYAGAMLLLPPPSPTLDLTLDSGRLNTGAATPIEWPARGGAAIGALDYGVLVAHNADHPMPTASIAKAILAVAVLRHKPIQAGQGGPIITFGDDDVAAYEAELARNGSVVPVVSGQSMTQYQALQALLLSSGNNIAVTLANWAFGSEQAYLEYVRIMLDEMRLEKTQVADTSGYSSQTVSTPRELVELGIVAMKNPIFAEIVSQRRATLPSGNELVNTNQVLGISDINGIKTGYTEEAGGCLLFSATRNVAGSNITLVGVVQALPDKSFAFVAAPELVEAGFQNFMQAIAISATQSVGTMSVPWAPSVSIVAQKDVKRTVWKGSELIRDVSAKPVASGVAGHVKVGETTSDLILQSNLPAPSPWWRLTHPVQMLQGRI